ncbi:hypothetical protein [Flexivirga alba]|uniref:Uncharacterized protein n=1 Tax=Flexivirga alba TaxID=702742 RepID=A0ABW2AKL0_9MICO
MSRFQVLDSDGGSDLPPGVPSLVLVEVTAECEQRQQPWPAGGAAGHQPVHGSPLMWLESQLIQHPAGCRPGVAAGLFGRHGEQGSGGASCTCGLNARDEQVEHRSQLQARYLLIGESELVGRPLHELR